MRGMPSGEDLASVRASYKGMASVSDDDNQLQRRNTSMEPIHPAAQLTSYPTPHPATAHSSDQ